jgi:hypothetical protein
MSTISSSFQLPIKVVFEMNALVFISLIFHHAFVKCPILGLARSAPGPNVYFMQFYNLWFSKILETFDILRGVPSGCGTDFAK